MGYLQNTKIRLTKDFSRTAYIPRTVLLKIRGGGLHVVSNLLLAATLMK